VILAGAFGDIRVELSHDPGSPGPGDASRFTLRLLDRANRALTADVFLEGRLNDGTRLQTRLVPRGPGTYSGTVGGRPRAATDLRLRVVLDDVRFDLPVRLTD
jgi:hypothetical protein